jgi:hypothetical protein
VFLATKHLYLSFIDDMADDTKTILFFHAIFHAGIES